MVKFLSHQGLSTYLNGQVFVPSILSTYLNGQVSVPSGFVHIPQWSNFSTLMVCSHTSMVKFLCLQGLSTYLNGQVFVPSRFVHISQWSSFCPLKVCPHISMVTSSAKIKAVFVPSRFVHIPQWSSVCPFKVCPHTSMVKFLSLQGLSTYLNGQVFIPSRFVHIPQWSNHQPAGCRQVRFSSLTRAHHGQRPIAVEVQQLCYIGQVHKASGVT